MVCGDNRKKNKTYTNWKYKEIKTINETNRTDYYCALLSSTCDQSINCYSLLQCVFEPSQRLPTKLCAWVFRLWYFWCSSRGMWRKLRMHWYFVWIQGQWRWELNWSQLSSVTIDKKINYFFIYILFISNTSLISLILSEDGNSEKELRWHKINIINKDTHSWSKNSVAIVIYKFNNFLMFQKVYIIYIF